ncbi:choice-of-anchor D domain-containing protein [Candidatus Albibeggiatoa sp. nov. NOAA]|uniref:RCC1 domain-containing protein n=1 Tax=Candidatus Albibeggiatoa sp. nov. NOAA TaxID=3162724 RepID=UPI0032FAF731|nr:choice-of-anchor D domain-containing protein [Thiotrichaceae bacterium]
MLAAPHLKRLLIFPILIIVLFAIPSVQAITGISEISAGGRYTCGKNSTGVKCWGFNEDGQLGNGSTANYLTPVDVSSLGSEVSTIASGKYHACALLDTGTVKCWGYNGSGRLGDGTTTDRYAPVDVNGLTGVSKIASGSYHSCALLDTGTVKCWGQNVDGQLGDGTTTNSSIPVDVNGLTGVSEIALGSYHSCALLDTGTVKCWGYNYNGQLGDGTYTDSQTPVDVSGLTGVDELSLGGYHSCALLDTGTVKCWGNNKYGQLGDGTTFDSNIPVSVSSLTGVSEISVGYDSNCALLSGSVECWGYNGNGELGDGTTTDQYTPVAISGLTNASNISLGKYHACALLDTTGVQCWGLNENAQIGDGTTSNSLTPVNVMAIPEMNLVGNGNSIVDGDTTPTTSDDTNFGSTIINTSIDKTFTIENSGGDGDLTLSGDPKVALSGAGCTMFGVTSQPTSPIPSSTSSNFTIRYTPTTATTHNCAISIDNDDANKNPYNFDITGTGLKADQIITFNPTVTGALGGSTTLSATADSGLSVTSFASSTTNVCTVSGTTLSFIAEGTCTVTADQAGDSNYNTATQVSSNILVYEALENVAQISGGNEHTCALLNTGGVQCWGKNDNGELGDGTTTQRLTPVDVVGLSGSVTAISLGSGHTCALLSTGGVQCWGNNGNGQLGNGTTTHSSTPVDVTGLSSGVTALGVGQNNSCAVHNGGVKCWGNNYGGKLGDGTIATRYTPVDVENLGGGSGVIAVSAGIFHSCALLDTGEVKCWGAIYGHTYLGDGSTTGSKTPVDVNLGISAIAIDASRSHSCALLDTGGVKCWGSNSNGQLGDGASGIDRLTPVNVNGLTSGVIAIGLSKNRSCALLNTGGVKCWGASYDEIPDNLVGISNSVTAIDSGVDNYHSCLLLDTNRVQCWGNNGNGKLGNNTTADSFVPVHVMILFPEMNLVGNSNNIVDGDTIPSTTDSTDFGSTPIGTSVDKIFTIENSGDVDLILSNSPIVALTGADCAIFSVTTQPTSPIATSANTNFTVRYSPITTGTHNCTISIHNNDPDESIYDFAITGSATAPEINLLGNNNSITDGSEGTSTTNHTDFGSTETGISVDKTFTIENTGSYALTLSGSPIVALTGSCGMFSVTTQPSSPIAISSSDTFTIRYNPTAVGTHNCIVNIDNDDTNEHPYDFAITGTATFVLAPSDLTANIPSNLDNIAQGVSLSWKDNSASEDEFILLRDGTELATIAADTTSYTDTTATACDKTYSYSLKAQNSDGESSSVSVTVSMPSCFVPPEPIPPYSPLNFVANPISYDQIQLTWNDDSTIETGYRIRRNGGLIATLDKNTETYTNENLQCETSYSYEVYAYNSVGESEHVTTTATTLTCPPNMPSQLSSIVTADTITLTWEDVEGETSYLVTREALTTRRQRAVIEFDLPADSTTFTDSGFECGQSYNYAVAAVADTSVSAAATITVAAEPCANAPIAPSQLNVSSSTDTSISLTWSDNSDNETGFYVFNNGGLAKEFSENSTSTTIQNLQCETSYSFQVTAFNDSDQASSESITATTSICPLVNLVAPSNFVATTINNQIQLTWKDNSLSETGFPIARNGEFIAVAPINAELFIDTHLECGTAYIYHLYATDNVINLGGLEEVVTTPECLPEDEFYIHLNTSGSGIINNCNSTVCSLSATAGSTINLVTTANAGWQFSHWSGDCSSTQLFVDAEKSCVAHFSQIPVEPEPELIPQPIVVNPLDPTTPTSAEPVPYVGGNLCGYSFTNHNSTSGDLTICESATVSGGELTGDNINEGIVASVELAENATITGGRMSGFNTNHGTLQNVTITQYSDVTGGFYAGTVNNNGTMIDPSIEEGSTIYSSTGLGTIAGITQNKGTIQGTIKLGVNTSIIGGVIQGKIVAPTKSPAYIGAAEIISGSTLQNVYLSPTVKLPRDVTLINVKFASNPAEPSLDDFGINMGQLDDLDARSIVAVEPAAIALFDRYEITDIPTEAFAGMIPEQTAALEPETLSSVSVEQFEQLSSEALAGFTADNIMALSPEVMQNLTVEKLEALSLESIQQAELVAKLLTNLPSDTPQEVINKILPQGWEISPTGKMIPSVGSKLSFKGVLNRLPSSISAPYLVDLQSSFSVGGENNENNTGSTVGGNLNTGLQQTLSIDTVDLSQFVFTQNDYGIFNVVGTGVYEDVVFSFMPNANNIEQAPLDTPVGLTTVEGGYFEMTTPDKQTFILINAPNNPVGLQQALGGESTIKLSPTGDVLMRIDTANTRSRNVRFETDVMMVGVFDAFVEPAPDDFCSDGEFCEFGMEFPTEFGNLRARQEAKVIYPDGSAQIIYPTVIYPETLVNLLEQYDPVSKVLYKADGTFEATVLINGQEQQYSLTPDININVRRLAAGEKRHPKVNLQGNVLLYEIQEGDDLLTFSLEVSL